MGSLVRVHQFERVCLWSEPSVPGRSAVIAAADLHSSRTKQAAEAGAAASGGCRSGAEPGGHNQFAGGGAHDPADGPGEGRGRGRVA